MDFRGAPLIGSKQRILSSLKKQPFQTFKTELRTKLTTLVEKLTKAQQHSQWTKASQARSPKDLWARQGVVSDFQI
ncbi:hypothetical protein V7S43_005429 [Phytophthora oleae]|uniref:Uncharacterized protein n=1 Tax=Phytophthora oleae TaxID=2107226 RepID=A0ABD3FQ33_9STRA